MLSRTASELYWMARYLERAESIARVLDVTNKLSMMPIRDSEDHDLQVPLNLTGTGQLYAAAGCRLSLATAVDVRDTRDCRSCPRVSLATVDDAAPSEIAPEYLASSFSSRPGCRLARVRSPS